MKILFKENIVELLLGVIIDHLQLIPFSQCPLCRHEYESGAPEVGSMFELAPIN